MLALKGLGIGSRIVGVSRQETLDAAFALDVIDAGYRYEDLESGIRDAALVFLCTPIVRILDMLPEVLGAARQDAVVTDVGSTKHAIVSAATAHHRDDVHFVGGHPMAGSEHRGVGAGGSLPVSEFDLCLDAVAGNARISWSKSSLAL